MLQMVDCLDMGSGVVNLRITPAVQERVDYLAERANEGLLTTDERREYAALIDAADLLAILKRKFSRQLRQSPG